MTSDEQQATEADASALVGLRPLLRPWEIPSQRITTEELVPR